jgi:hypothetical protein
MNQFDFDAFNAYILQKADIAGQVKIFQSLNAESVVVCVDVTGTHVFRIFDMTRLWWNRQDKYSSSRGCMNDRHQNVRSATAEEVEFGSDETIESFHHSSMNTSSGILETATEIAIVMNECISRTI